MTACGHGDVERDKQNQVLRRTKTTVERLKLAKRNFDWNQNFAMGIVFSEVLEREPEKETYNMRV